MQGLVNTVTVNLLHMTCPARRTAVDLNVCSANYGWPVELQNYIRFFVL